MTDSSPSVQQRLCAVVSQPFANQIVNGTRKPSLKTAFAIFDETGLKFGQLEGATAAEIRLLRRLHMRHNGKATS